jgi:hypothetical protein
MKNSLIVIATAILFLALQASDIKAQHAFGHSGMAYDSVNRVVRGYSRTEVDYNTAAYYSPSVCGSLSANGVEKVRSCRSGLLSATANTQFVGAPDNAALVSDHYVDMVLYDEGTSSYEDYYGYSFLPGYTYPLDGYFEPPNVLTHRQPVSIRVGATNVQAQQPQVSILGYSFTPLSIKKQGGTPGDTTTLKVRVTASESEAFNNVEVTVSIVHANGNATLDYPDGKVLSKKLNKGGFIEVEFRIQTRSTNMYTGEVEFQLFIDKVVDRNTNPNTDISANIKIRPADGLITSQRMPPPPNILSIVP